MRRFSVVLLFGFSLFYTTISLGQDNVNTRVERVTVTRQVERQLEDGTIVIEEVPVTVERVVPVGPGNQNAAPPQPGTVPQGQAGNNNPSGTSRQYIDKDGNVVIEYTIKVPRIRTNPDGSTETYYTTETRSRVAPNTSGASNSQRFTGNSFFQGSNSTNQLNPVVNNQNTTSPQRPGMSSQNSGLRSMTNPSQSSNFQSFGNPPVAPNNGFNFSSRNDPPIATPVHQKSNDPPVAPPRANTSVKQHSAGDPPPLPQTKFSNLPILLKCNADPGESLQYTLLDGDHKYPITMRYGEEQKLQHDRNWIVQYEGNAKEVKQFKLRGDKVYVFQRDATGTWQLYLSD